MFYPGTRKKLQKRWNRVSNEKKKKINIQHDSQNSSEILLLSYFFHNAGGFYNNTNFYLHLSNDHFQGTEMLH